MQASFRPQVALTDHIDWSDALVRSMIGLGELTGCAR